MSNKVVTRFAPSPTGFMHVGNLRTGLFAWLWARKNNGTFILRIEDTDKKREVEGSLEHIKKSLRWIGIDWDEGPDVGGPHAPYIQSERRLTLQIYEKYAQKLINAGFAYADSNTEEYIEQLRKQAEVEKRAFLYRDHRPENTAIWKLGIPLRFKIKEPKRTVWHDLVRGELSAGPEALDDFILIKSDGYPTYNFAHIVDDIEMGITHIIRGQEFISSTPNYIAVYEALNAPQPQYVTAPPIMGEEGNKKMGKRDGAKDVLEYERDGYLPETMLNFLAFLGWNPGGEKEIFNTKELIEAFDLSKIQKSGARFNEEKLDWMNKEHIKLLPKETLQDEISKRLKIDDEEFVKRITPTIIDHISKWGDIDAMLGAGEFSYFLGKP
ncbi:MAG: glutamate--tRNA ligase, partial [Minisyncoccia bacterium]